MEVRKDFFMMINRVLGDLPEDKINELYNLMDSQSFSQWVNFTVPDQYNEGKLWDY